MILSELRRELAASVEGVGGLRAYDYPPAQVTTPAAVVEPEEVDYRTRSGAAFMRGGEVWRISMFILVAPIDAEQAARKVDQFFDRSAGDLKDRIETVRKGTVAVTTADRWGEYPMRDGTVYAGLRLMIEVLA